MRFYVRHNRCFIRETGHLKELIRDYVVRSDRVMVAGAMVSENCCTVVGAPECTRRIRAFLRVRVKHLESQRCFMPETGPVHL